MQRRRLLIAAALSPAWAAPGQALVSLSYDDALPSQLDIAFPALQRHGLRASFYPTLAAETLGSRLADWRRVAAAGHELGNHTLFHGCSRGLPDRDWVPPQHDLDRSSVAAKRDEIQLANRYLEAIDGRTGQRTLTVPCGDLLAGGQPWLPAVREAFVAIKTRAGDGVSPKAQLDWMDIQSFVPVGASGAELIAVVERAAAIGGLASILFHGVGGDHLAVSAKAHEALLAHLAAHPARFRVDGLIRLAAQGF
jgi:peptidoglycan/xylan/chitin deacetylase (PgdA/CDA1 family)